jgi:hypothetical protein
MTLCRINPCRVNAAAVIDGGIAVHLDRIATSAKLPDMAIAALVLGDVRRGGIRSLHKPAVRTTGILAEGRGWIRLRKVGEGVSPGPAAGGETNMPTGQN